MATEARIGVAVVLAVRAAAVLVTRRDPSSHLGGTWEFPGGKVENGEHPVDAARRELREETGLEAERLESLLTSFHDYPDRRIRFHVFVADDAQGPVSIDGAREHRWVAVDDLDDLDMPEANGTFIRALRWRIRGAGR